MQDKHCKQQIRLYSFPTLISALILFKYGLESINMTIKLDNIIMTIKHLMVSTISTWAEQWTVIIRILRQSSGQLSLVMDSGSHSS